MIALDQRLLMEFTQHILPNKIETTVFPSYRSGNYAFMFDDEGWAITHPKLWDIRGVDKSGKWVPAFSSTTKDSTIAAGYIPFNLDDAAFIHPNYPFVADEIRRKNAGVVGAILAMSALRRTIPIFARVVLTPSNNARAPTHETP